MECTAIVLDRTEIVFAEAQNQSASGSRSEAMGINEGSSSGSWDGHSGQCPSEIGNDTSNCVTKKSYTFSFFLKLTGSVHCESLG